MNTEKTCWAGERAAEQEGRGQSREPYRGTLQTHGCLVSDRREPLPMASTRLPAGPQAPLHAQQNQGWCEKIPPEPSRTQKPCVGVGAQCRRDSGAHCNRPGLWDCAVCHGLKMHLQMSFPAHGGSAQGPGTFFPTPIPSSPPSLTLLPKRSCRFFCLAFLHSLRKYLVSTSPVMSIVPGMLINLQKRVLNKMHEDTWAAPLL